MNSASTPHSALPTAPHARWRIERPARGAVDNARDDTMLNAIAPLTGIPSEPTVLRTPSFGGACITNAPVAASTL